MKTFYLVYKLTNLVNGKIYVGCHMTKDIDDGYMGSGKRIGYAKKKYGVENFKKEILSFHETPEKMLAEEKLLVNEEFLGRDDVYNLMCGGRGCWFIVNRKLTAEQRTKAGKAGGYANLSFEQRSKAGKKGKKGIWKNGDYYASEFHQRGIIAAQSENSASKRIDSFKKICHQQGDKNSQFGTQWITNGLIRKKIKKDDIIPDGWKRGRKLNA